MELRVELRQGGLEAVVFLDQGPYEPDKAVQAVAQRLQELGVPLNGDDRGVRVALSAFEGGEAVPDGVVIARGEPPQPGIPAQVVAFFPLKDTPLEPGEDPFERYPTNVAYTGEPVLQKTPPSPGIPGKSLTGVPIPAPDGADIPVVAGGGVVEEEDGTFRATTYGVVLFHRGRLQVVSAVDVAEDKMEARLCVLPDTRVDLPTQVGKLKGALDRLGVRAGLDDEALEAAARAAQAGGRAVADVVVARGTPPVHGRETDYKILFDPGKKVGKELEGGRIDFREVEAVKNVTRGEALAEVVPGVDPVPGQRVDGSAIRPRMERAQGLKPGQNVVPSEDGTRILADADGMVIVQGNLFHVADQYLVSGDVDYRTGNIRATGDVEIRGEVKPGFEVHTEKDVVIHKDVEEAVVEAGGSVTIRGGVTASSRVVAGGNVSVRHVLNSRVEAEGDLEVKISLTNAEVYVHGRVLAVQGQGTIRGGEVNATRGVEARSVGSEAAATHIAVGVDLRVLRDIEQIDAQREKLATAMSQIQSNLGPAFLKNPRAALEAMPVALRRPKLEMLQKIKDLYQKDADLKAQREMLVIETQSLRKATVTVQGEVFAGTRITVSTACLKLAETMRRVQFYFDTDKNTVAWKKI